MGRGRRNGATAAWLLAVLALSGCGARPVIVSPAAPAATAAAEPSGDRELARFTAVADAVVRGDRDPGGMAFIRALERAGYHRSLLQVTADRTSVGLAVPAVQFAARSGDSCLLGQYGDGGLHVLRADPVDGTCLLGDTRDLG